MKLNHTGVVPFKVKSLEDKVNEFKMTFGKYQDELLDDVPIEYLDWCVREYKYLKAWDKKVINKYIKMRAIEISEKAERDSIEKELADEEAAKQKGEMLGWVDENF
jgi:hypothetical protein